MGAVRQEPSHDEMRHIGCVERGENGARQHVFEGYCKGLDQLGAFGRIQVPWRLSECDDKRSRAKTQADPPFDTATLGVFALGIHMTGKEPRAAEVWRWVRRRAGRSRR